MKGVTAKSIIAGVLMSVSIAAQGELQGNAVLTFDVTTSNFGMRVSPGFILRTPVESFDGIILGTAQLASGSHQGIPDGSESPGIDQPWEFFGNTGMHQSTVPVTVLSDNGAGTVTLDFSGWNFTWNGLPGTPLGTRPWEENPAGVAIMTCANTCEPGDSFHLDYSATVPQDDPSRFGNVGYNLNLDGTIGVGSTAFIDIEIPEEPVQECGPLIQMNAIVAVPDGDAVNEIAWYLDDEYVASGEVVELPVPLGSHTVEAILSTVLGKQASSTTSISVQDTLAPQISAAFTDSQTGAVITSISARETADIAIDVTDLCDPAPIVDATVGLPAQDGDTMAAHPSGRGTSVNLSIRGNAVRGPAGSVELVVTAEDGSGNRAVETATLEMSP